MEFRLSGEDDKEEENKKGKEGWAVSLISVICIHSVGVLYALRFVFLPCIYWSWFVLIYVQGNCVQALKD